MRIRLLGPVEITGDNGVRWEIGGPRLRMLLARLAFEPNRVVSAEALVNDLWAEKPPSDAVNALQSLVSRLRKALPPEISLKSAPNGYLLEIPDHSIDAIEFERLAAQGGQELAARDLKRAVQTLDRALSLWHGEALSDLSDAPFAAVYSTKLTQLKATAVENKFHAVIECGEPERVIADLEEFTLKYPLRERAAALRMRALTAVGRQAEALAWYEQVRRKLADELGVDPSDELKDAQLAVLRGEFSAPVRTFTDSDNRLPVRLTSFIGRDQEFALLTKLLAASRLVTLVGAGGAGKTRLATEAVSAHPSYQHGQAWFVPLAGVRDSKDIYSAILNVLASREVRIRDDLKGIQHADSFERIVELLRGSHALLVLDNCEHLVDAVADLCHRLLSRLSELHILATSREPLAITGEALCPIGPLELPQSGSDVQQAILSDSVRLFVDRANAVQPDFQLDHSTVEPVVEICQRLDGMPLALELAAARLRSMTAHQIAQRLDDRFRLLNVGTRGALPRQQTLRAVVEWSWDLLTEPELVLARRLSVFPAGADAEAIEEVCAGGVLPAEEMFYVLGSLVEKSIVDAFDGGGDKPRYRMLETIRVYAGERLRDSDEYADIHRRLIGYLTSLVHQKDAQLRGPNQLAAFAAMDIHRENILAVMREAIEEENIAVALPLGLCSLWYWIVRGFDDQVSSFVNDVSRFPGQLSNQAAVTIRLVKVLLDSVPSVPEGSDVRSIIDEAVEADIIGSISALAMAVPALALFSRNPELIERETARALESKDPWARACGYWILRYSAMEQGNLKAMKEAGNASLRLFRESGDRWGIASALGTQGDGYSLEGKHEEALACYREGLTLAREIGARDEATQYQTKLILELIRSRALSHARKEIEHLKDADSPGDFLLAMMLEMSSLELARAAGDFAQAHLHLDQLKTLLPKLSFPMEIAKEWQSRSEAALLISEGSLEEAKEPLGTSVRLAVQRKDMPDVAVGFELAAALLWREGNARSATVVLGMSRAVRGFLDLGSPEVGSLIADLKRELGESAYSAAFQQGAEPSRAEALSFFAHQFGIELPTHGI